MYLLFMAGLCSLAAARPSFIAVPADQIAFVDLSSLHLKRVPRQTLQPPPLPLYQQQEYQPIPIISQQYQHLIPLAPLPEQHPTRVVTLQQQQHQDGQGQASAPPSAARIVDRPPDFGEYIDFGAHTGDQGAFGWYADYPINNHEDSSRSDYRK